jgi:hypothetical protein
MSGPAKQILDCLSPYDTGHTKSINTEGLLPTPRVLELRATPTTVRKAALYGIQASLFRLLLYVHKLTHPPTAVGVGTADQVRYTN